MLDMSQPGAPKKMSRNRMRRPRFGWRSWRGVLLAALCAGSFAPSAMAQTCGISFEVVVTHGIGPYPPGTIIPGDAQFEIRHSMRQDPGSTAHLSEGHMTIDGDISGRLWTVVSTSQSQNADLVGLYAMDVEGLSYVGTEFRGPMSITLFGEPSSWDYDRPPLTQEEWDVFSTRRSFHLSAAPWNDSLSGEVTAFDVECQE